MDNELKIIGYLATFIWILPIIKQYKTKLSRFFMMLGIKDLVSIIFFYTVAPNTYLTNISFTYFAFLTFFDKSILIKRWYYFAVIYLLIFLGWLISPNWENHALLLCLFQVFLIFAIIHYFIADLVYGKFNIPTFILIANMFILFSNVVIILVFDYAEIYRFYFFTFFVEIFIALFFVLFRVDDDRLAIQL